MGACIALTAFPMLARIINERGLAKTSLGTLSLTAGAFDDAASWCVLAVVLATFGGGPGRRGDRDRRRPALCRLHDPLRPQVARPAGPHGREATAR
jgi:hypothetical protein